MNINPPYHDTTNQLLYAILQHYESNPMTVNVPLPPYYTITNRLLYEILQNLGNQSSPPVIYYQFRVMYVSARYGEDLTAEPNNINKPFKTIGAATFNMYFGDMVHVLPGNYNEGNIFGSRRIWFDLGATINYSGSGAIFQQAHGECIVRGYGVFKCTGSANVVDAGNWLNSVLDIECESMEAVQSAVILGQNRMITDPTNYKPHRIVAKRVYSSEGSAIHLHFNSHTEIRVDEIVSDSTTTYVVYGTNPRLSLIKNSNITANNFAAIYMDALGKVEINNCKIICNWDNFFGHGLLIHTVYNAFEINSTSISCKNPDANSIFSNTGFNLYLDNNVTANRDIGGITAITYKSNYLLLELSEATIDISDNTSIDLLHFQNTEVIKLTSVNNTETLLDIVNAPKHRSFKLLPTGNLSLQINSTNPENATETSITLESQFVTLEGVTGDWIELHNGKYGLGNRQVIKSNYINYEPAG